MSFVLLQACPQFPVETVFPLVPFIAKPSESVFGCLSPSMERKSFVQIF